MRLEAGYRGEGAAASVAASRGWIARPARSLTMLDVAEPYLHSDTLRFPRTTQSSREDRDAAPTSYRVAASSGTTTPSRGSALYLYEAEIDECCLEQER